MYVIHVTCKSFGKTIYMKLEKITKAIIDFIDQSCGYQLSLNGMGKDFGKSCYNKPAGALSPNNSSK